jgi:DNA-binding winged helix-turn-helix (wHTH) protein/tetratricopeptide (TPR) repeat protein
MASRNNQIFEFSDFRLVPGEGLLLRNEQPVRLSMKAFATLVLLVQRHGHLVEKSELLEEIWGETFVEEAAVSRCVWNIRNALGDTSKERFIQTIPRRGYRFIFPVSIVTDASGSFRSSDLASLGEEPLVGAINSERSETNGSAPLKISSAVAGTSQLTSVPLLKPIQQPQTRGKGKSGWLIYAGALASLFIVTGLYFAVSESDLFRKHPVTRIAVLPLAALDARTSNTGYDFGVTEALILKLAGNKKITVRQLNAVRHYANSDKDPVEAGREQRVDYVLSGNYQLADGKIRVTAQLIDVASGEVDGTFTSDDDAANSLAAQGTIANNIGNKLLTRFGSAATQFVSERGTSDAAAYQNYQQALTLLDQQRPGSIEKARQYLDRAVDLDPNYANAWAGKAYAHSLIWGQGRPFEPEGIRERYEKSMEAARKALTIDPNLSDGYTSLCENKFAYEFNFDEAEKDCKRAIELDPTSPVAHRLYSMLLTSRGRSGEALREIERAMELEPVSLRNQRIFADTLYYERRFSEAIEVYKRLFDLNPDAPATHLYLIRSLERSGRVSEALNVLIDLLTLQKKDNATIERFKAVYSSIGWSGVLNERIKTELQEKSPQYSVIAELYGLLGDKDKAFEYLEKGSQKRGWMKMFLRVDPRFDSLRHDARFADIVRLVEEK